MSERTAGTWAVVGDSISEYAFSCRAAKSAPPFLWQDTTKFGMTSAWGKRYIDYWLKHHPLIRNWAIAFGTDDARIVPGHSTPQQSADAYAANMAYIVNAVIAA